MHEIGPEEIQDHAQPCTFPATDASPCSNDDSDNPMDSESEIDSDSQIDSESSTVSVDELPRPDSQILDEQHWNDEFVGDLSG